ncbi:probable tubulin polyglutamylase ttll-15 [Eurosta solidaginis]|uniref:probable tubulin polyglutamylase ttll-15 n=1 Tax=Eurosta solidaginis TaxID=178769 RepID=UPI0035307BD1
MGFAASVLITICAAAGLEIILDLYFWDTNVKKQGPSDNPGWSSIRYKVYPDINATDNHLRHVILLLEKMGYKQAPIYDSDWDLLWAHEYPFLNASLSLQKVLYHQIVNHFPGIGFITSKVHLSTAALPFMPKAFRLPTQKYDFLKYAENNPDLLFVEKHNNHRFINIRSSSSINLNSSNSFIQEFIQNPFLVDGHKFDIGVYVVLTSVDPLIIYIYTGDALFRYCLAKYYPFDARDVDKYVVGNNYLPTWKVHSLIKYYTTLGGSMQATFDAYVKDQGMNPSEIWLQVEEIIPQTILSKIHEISNKLKMYQSGIFFELLRFDFIVDDALKVYLMEVNMSPNLSSAHFKKNSLLYDQILYSVFNLVGIGSSLKNNRQKLHNKEEIVTSDKNIVINLNNCVRHLCHESCTTKECELCLSCLNVNQVNILKKAYYEHLHKIDMKRIYPKPVANPENFDIEAEVRNLSTKNAWLARWYYWKCKENRSWCQ